MPHKISWTRTLPEGVTSGLSDEGKAIFKKYHTEMKIIDVNIVDNGLCSLVFANRQVADEYLSELYEIDETGKTGSYRSELTREDI